MSGSRLRPYLGPVVALLVVLVIGAGAVYAAIPNNGTYYACLTKSTGDIRVINYPKVKCAKGQTLLKWSQQGPAGPQGRQGDPGAKGDQGPKGDPGPADWNAIPNIPAGFADGVDNVGYVSSVEPGTFTADFGVAVAVRVDHPVGTDVGLTIIPEPGTNVEVSDEYYERLSDGTLRYRLDVTNTDFFDDPVTFKVRTQVYNAGIAPVAFRKALKHVKVSVTKVRRHAD